MAEERAGWLSELNDREALLVHAFRCAAAALTDSERAAWSDVQRTVGRLARPGQSDEAVRAFGALMRIVGAEARAHVRFHVPRCPCLGQDEAVFLALCRQMSAGRSGRAHATAQTLIQDRAITRLLRGCAAFLRRIDTSPATEGDALNVAARQPERANGARLH